MSNSNKVNWGGADIPKKWKWWLRSTISGNEILMAKATHKINEILAGLWINSIKEFADYLNIPGNNMNMQTDKMWEFKKILYTWSWAELIKHLGAIYRKPKGKWKYVRLASGLISDGYVNFWATERDFRVFERVSGELAGQIMRDKEKIGEIDVIMWAQMWSVRISSFLGKALDVKNSIYAEKDWDDLKLKRHDIGLKWKNVILSEDVITKGSTIEKMIELVKKGGWKVTAITCVINRSGKDNYNWIPIYTCYVPEKFNMFYDWISVLEAFRKEIYNKWYWEEFIRGTLGLLVGTNEETLTDKNKIKARIDWIHRLDDKTKLKKMINSVFDKFEKDWVMPFPKKGKIEGSPKVNWSELVSVM